MNEWAQNKDKLLMVWSSGDIEVAEKMILMYAGVMMDRQYWKEAILMIWGASVRLLAEKSELQAKVQKIKSSGVQVCACVACVDEYDVRNVYEEIGIEIIHTGSVMTDCLKNGWRSITI